MKHLTKTYNDLATKLNEYDGLDFEIKDENDFDSKLAAIKEITQMQVELKKLKEENKSGVVRVNRKGQVLELLIKDTLTISQIAKELGVTHRNVSSVLCYLRKDGKEIKTARIGGETYVTLEVAPLCD